MCVNTFQTEDMYVPHSTGKLARDHLEPISTRDDTKRIIETVDTQYEKATLLEIVEDICEHLPSKRANQVLTTTYQAS